MKGIIFILFCLIFISNGISQTKKSLNGLVFNENKETLNQINIINTTHLSGSTTNKDGFFGIPVFLGDTITFSSVNYINQKLVVTDSVFDLGHIQIFLVIDHVNLPDVVLSSFSTMDTNKSGGPVKMSLPFKHDVVYKNPNQRKLESLKFNGVNYLGTIITALNGEKKKIKNILNKENEDKRFEQIRKKYNNDFYLKLGIPEEEINNFIDFIYLQANAEGLFKPENSFELIQLMELKSKPFLEELKTRK